MRLFEAIIDANHRAVDGGAKMSPSKSAMKSDLAIFEGHQIRRQLVTNRHRLNVGCCRVSQPVTNCYRLKAAGSQLVTNCNQLKADASE
jgi:hypothetical protein